MVTSMVVCEPCSVPMEQISNFGSWFSSPFYHVLSFCWLPDLSVLFGFHDAGLSLLFFSVGCKSFAHANLAAGQIRFHFPLMSQVRWPVFSLVSFIRCCIAPWFLLPAPVHRQRPNSLFFSGPFFDSAAESASISCL
jgi:hypothetical protein